MFLGPAGLNLIHTRILFNMILKRLNLNKCKWTLTCKQWISSKRRVNTFNAMTDAQVTVSQGRLQGAVKTLFDGSPYYSFKGIPYAQPPVGPLRFKAPLPPNPWNGVYQAIDHGPVCPQMDFTTGEFIEGDENCLFLNVYSKSLTSSSNQPVMVFIHGGGFMSYSGDSDLFGPEYLLQHDVVLVTINYRLEVLGFLCLDTPDIPGNAGMKDQVAALRWVKENITQFGGDATNVTIFGESAGSSSVTYHLLSPMSKGLFQKAIVQSGVFLNDWSQGKDGKERAFRAGKVLGKDTNDVVELTEHLRSQPAVNLVKLTFKTMTNDEKHRGLPIHFAPVVEKKFDNVEAFLSDDPMEMLLRNDICHVPLIVGYNSGEGIMSSIHSLKKIDFVNKNIHFKIPRAIASKVSEPVLKEFGERIKKFYFNSQDITVNDRQKIAELDADIYFTFGTHLFVYLLSKYSKAPIFMYRFGYVSEINVMKNLMNGSGLEGASHADDLFYLFGNMMTSDIYAQNEHVRNMVYTVTKLWTDFAKTGNPTADDRLGVSWQPYTRRDKEFLNLDGSLSMGRFSDRERVEFWNKLYHESGLPCLTRSNL